MIGGDYIFGKIGTFIIWMLKGFRGSFYELESKSYKYNFIVGLVISCLVFYLIYVFCEQFL